MATNLATLVMALQVLCQQTKNFESLKANERPQGLGLAEEGVLTALSSFPLEFQGSS